MIQPTPTNTPDAITHEVEQFCELLARIYLHSLFQSRTGETQSDNFSMDAQKLFQPQTVTPSQGTSLSIVTKASIYKQEEELAEVKHAS